MVWPRVIERWEKRSNVSRYKALAYSSYTGFGKWVKRLRHKCAKRKTGKYMNTSEKESETVRLRAWQTSGRRAIKIVL
jgi:hypothetical protein